MHLSNKKNSFHCLVFRILPQAIRHDGVWDSRACRGYRQILFMLCLVGRKPFSRRPTRLRGPLPRRWTLWLNGGIVSLSAVRCAAAAATVAGTAVDGRWHTAFRDQISVETQCIYTVHRVMPSSACHCAHWSMTVLLHVLESFSTLGTSTHGRGFLSQWACVLDL